MTQARKLRSLYVCHPTDPAGAKILDEATMRSVDDSTRADKEMAPMLWMKLRNLDRVTSLLRFNGTKDGPYKSTSRVGD